jgi:hypothetical protein
MTTIVYPIQRAIDRPIVFKGFQAQYIVYAGLSLIADLLLFVLLYLVHTPPWICMLLVFGLGITALTTAARLSTRFGRSGLMKHFASKNIPRHIRCNSRRAFLNLLVNHHVHPTQPTTTDLRDR